MHRNMISTSQDAVMLAQDSDIQPEDAVQQAIQKYNFDPSPKEYNLLLHAVRVDLARQESQSNNS